MLELPTDAEALFHRDRNLAAMKATLSAGDIQEPDVVKFCSFFNGGKWRGAATYKHLHVPGRCPFGCSDEAEGLTHAKTLCRLAFDRGFSPPLEYRWKGMDWASAYFSRGREFADLLPKSLRRMYSQRAVEIAQAQVDAAAPDAELPYEVRTTAKAGGVLRSIDADKDGYNLAEFMLATKPVHRFLNKTQAVDKALSKYQNSVMYNAAGEDTEALLKKLLKANMMFFSGENGRTVVKSFFGAITSFEDEAWKYWDGPTGRQLKICERMIRSMSDAWKRLVFYVEDVRFECLTGLVNVEDPGRHDPAKAAALAASLKSRAEQCPHCVVGFARGFATLVDRFPRLATETATTVASVTAIGSGIVERAHMPGQELHKARQRGLAPAAQTLASLTYVRSVIQEAHNVSKLAKEAVFKKRGLTPTSFSRLASTYLAARRTETASKRHVQGRAAQRRKQRVVNRTLKTQSRRRRAMCGFTVFRAENWSVRAQVGSQMFRDEEKRIADLWKDADENVKAIAEETARTRQAAFSEALASELTAAAVSQAGNGAVLQHTARQLNHALFEQALAEIDSHPAYASGLRLFGPCSGLRTSVIDGQDKPHRYYTEAVARLMRYDSVELPNPAGTMQPEKSCHAQNFGVCIGNPHLERAATITYNVYVKLGQWKLHRKSFPILVQFRAGGASRWHLLTDTLGEGQSLLLVEVVEVVAGTLAIKEAAGLPVCTFAQMAICALLEDKDAPSAGVKAIDFDVLKHQPVLHENGYALQAAGVHECAIISAVEKLNGTKKRKRAEEAKPVLPFGLLEVPVASAEAAPEKPMSAEDKQDPAEDDRHDFEDKPADELTPEEADEAMVDGGEEKDDFHLATSSRVGVVEYGLAASGRSKCALCQSLGLSEDACKIRIGSGRFYWRSRVNVPDRSIHEACVLEGGILEWKECRARHISESAALLTELATRPGVEPARQVVLLDAADVFRAAGSRPSASSGAAAAPAPASAGASGSG